MKLYKVMAWHVVNGKRYYVEDILPYYKALKQLELWTRAGYTLSCMRSIAY